MVTMVGKQSDFSKAMHSLVELEYDALSAYKTAIESLENQKYRQQLITFSNDHTDHIKKLTKLLQQHDAPIPDGPDTLKHLIVKGKVVIAKNMGDKAILGAMLSNEEDTNRAYENMLSHTDMWPDANATIKKNWEDERRHKNWLEKVIK